MTLWAAGAKTARIRFFESRFQDRQQDHFVEHPGSSSGTTAACSGPNRRGIVQQICKCSEISSSSRPWPHLRATIAEIQVPHRRPASRGARNIRSPSSSRLNFDLMNGVFALPDSAISTFGARPRPWRVAFSIFLFHPAPHYRTEAEGLFTRVCDPLCFIGIMILALGIIGEYVGRFTTRCASARDW